MALLLVRLVTVRECSWTRDLGSLLAANGCLNRSRRACKPSGTQAKITPNCGEINQPTNLPTHRSIAWRKKKPSVNTIIATCALPPTIQSSTIRKLSIYGIRFLRGLYIGHSIVYIIYLHARLILNLRVLLQLILNIHTFQFVQEVQFVSS